MLDQVMGELGVDYEVQNGVAEIRATLESILCTYHNNAHIRIMHVMELPYSEHSKPHQVVYNR